MSNTGNNYTEEFRRDAVELLRSSGRPISQVARELGVNVNSLRTWRNRILGQSEGESFGAVGDKDRAGASAEELLAEIKQLKKENEYLKRQREILKKAASILSENPELGMR
jgi:transposase